MLARPLKRPVDAWDVGQAAWKVLHSPMNVAGGPGAISAGLREIGVESTLLVFKERPFQRGFDVNLELRDTSKLGSIPYNLPKQLQALQWAVRNFDVFHFHAGLTASRRITLPLLGAGKRDRLPVGGLQPAEPQSLGRVVSGDAGA